MATKSFYQRLALLLLTSLFLGVQALTSQAQATAFTYQGRFNDGGTAANGTYDFSFRLATDPAANNYVGGTVLTNGVPIANGLFTVTLDFGPGLFVGSNYWLEVDARTNGATAFTTLSPRQAVTPAPYAIMANSASNLLGNLPAGQVSGPLANANLPADPTFSGTVTATSLTGNGANVSSVNALALNGLNATNFWQTGGNNVGNGQFLGSTNNQSVEVRVNRQRAILIIPTAIDAPNIIGGAPVNVVDAGIKGAVIAGGGTTNFLGVSSSNRISADFSAIVGGSGNSIQAGADHAFIGSGWNNTVSNSSYQSVISGGQNNSIAAIYSVIGGGLNNVVPSGSTYSTVGGGDNNVAGGANAPGYSVASTVAGGESNSALQPYATIAGGLFNTNSAFGAAIGGGSGNLILPDYNGSAYATIGGGWNNWNFALEGTIAGGRENIINTNGAGATIAGGVMNNIAANNFPGTYNGSVIGGGLENTNNGNYSTVSGGVLNTIQFGADGASVGGGSLNTIYTNANHSVISGGANNSVLPGTIYSSLGGGQNNSIQTNANYSTIGGGQNNSINSGINTGTIGGGLGNVVSGLSGTVAGGENNQASAFRDAVGGGILNSASGGISTVAGGWTNTASGNASSIGGGDHNLAGALEAVISGGSGNQATNIWATIPGGQNNVAGGAYSFAAGQQAQATNDGAFVWADSQNAPFASTTNNQFNVRATGGVRFVTGGASLTVDGFPLLASGGGSGITIQNNSAGAPNIINGSPFNFVSNSVVGATISGGGATSYQGFGYTNSVIGDFGTVGGGQQNLAGPGDTVGGGSLNAAVAGYSTIGGGIKNTNITSNYGVIAGGDENQITGAGASAIGGGANNYIWASDFGDFFCTIAGGWYNTESNVILSSIGGGESNLDYTSYSVIGGGVMNTLDAFARYSVIGGGQNNLVSSNSDHSFIGGGLYNVIGANSLMSVIAGGASNFISANSFNSTIGGGSNNVANGISSTVAGGEENSATAFRDTVGGGLLNTASGGISTVAGGWTNVSSGNASAIGGGSHNLATALAATVAGGALNQATNNYATVPGGLENIAGATDSFAAGQQAQALHQGAFVWADSQNATFSSTTNDEFSVRANNGIRISSDKGIHLNNADRPLIVRDWDPFAATASNGKAGIGRWGLFMEPTYLTIGIPSNDIPNRFFQIAKYATNGSYTALVVVDQAGDLYASNNVYAKGVQLTSDRNAKEHFASLNAESVLAKVTALPVTEWNYKSDDAGTKHIGPVAQDFHAAFGLNGEDDKHISAVDESGVALAAIQGLNQKLNEKDAEIQKLKTENETLAARLNDLEAAVKSLANNRP